VSGFSENIYGAGRHNETEVFEIGVNQLADDGLIYDTDDKN
jgi:hypothetical protein